MYLGGTEKFYAMPDKRQSNGPSESHYTEIEDNFKPKNRGLQTTSSAGSLTINDKFNDILKSQISQNSHIRQGHGNNSFVDLRHASASPYDKLRRSNLGTNNPRLDCSSHYSSVPQNSGTNVHFRQNKNDNLTPIYSNVSGGKLAQDCNSCTSQSKKTQISNYCNINPVEVYNAKTVEDVRVKPKRGNHKNPLTSTVKNSGVLELYAETYSDPSEVNCENECYG